MYFHPRRCLSLNNLSYFENEIIHSIHSQSLFDISTDNEKGILKPLPFKNYQYETDSGFQLNYSLRKENKHFKQRKYSKKKQSKKYQQKQISTINSIKEDFYLLNRIFLRENKQELKEKPYLAIKYQQQSIIEKQKLNKFIQKYPLHRRFKSQSTTNLSFNNNSSTIFI